MAHRQRRELLGNSDICQSNRRSPILTHLSCFLPHCRPTNLVHTVPRLPGRSLCLCPCGPGRNRFDVSNFEVKTFVICVKQDFRGCQWSHDDERKVGILQKVLHIDHVFAGESTTAC